MAIGEVKFRAQTGKWQGEYRDRDGKRCFVSDENKHKAQAKLRKAMNEVEAGTHAKGPITLGQAIDEYLYDCEKRARRGDVSNAFVRAEQGACKRTPDNIKRMKLSAFEHSAHIKEAINELRDKGYAIRTVKMVAGTLSRVFDFAVQPPRRYIPRNVVRDYPIRVGKAPRRQNVATIDDARILLRAAAERQKTEGWLTHLNLYAAVCLVIATGCRPEEAFGLQVEDVRRFERPPPDRPTIWADVTIQNTNTVDGGFQRRTKNDEIRVVPIGRLVLDAFNRVECYWQAERDAKAPGHVSYEYMAVKARIQRRVKHHLENPETVERRQHGPVFVNPEGGLLDSASIGFQIRKLMRRAGLVERDEAGRIVIGANGKAKPKFSLYSFRHMVSTHNALRLPTHVGASVTGHSEKTYLSAYVHRSAGDEALIAGSLGELERELEREASATNLQRRLLTR